MLDSKYADFYRETINPSAQPEEEKKNSSLKKASFLSLAAIFFACTFASITSPSEVTYSTNPDNFFQANVQANVKDASLSKDATSKNAEPNLQRDPLKAPINPIKLGTDDAAASESSYARNLSLFGHKNTRSDRENKTENPSVPVAPRSSQEPALSETSSETRALHEAVATKEELPHLPEPLAAFLFFNTALLALTTARKSLLNFGHALILKIGQVWDKYWEDLDKEDRQEIAEEQKYAPLKTEPTLGYSMFKQEVNNQGQRYGRTHLFNGTEL